MSLRENADTTTATGRFFLSMTGAIHQMERELRAERAAAGRELTCGDPAEGSGQQNNEMAAYSLALYCMHMFLHGMELDRVTAEYAAYAKPLRALNSEVGMGFLTSPWQAALNFQGDAPEPWVLKGEVADEASVLSAFEAAHNNSLIATTLLSSGMLCLFFGKHEEGIARLDRAVGLSDYTVGTFGGARIQCYSVLTRLFAWEQLPPRSRLGHWKRMLPSLLRIRRYARYAPENHLHLYYLVRAERMRLRKRPAEAMRFYQLASTRNPWAVRTSPRSKPARRARCPCGSRRYRPSSTSRPTASSWRC